MSLQLIPIPLRSVVMGEPPNYSSFLAGSTSFADFLAGLASWQPESVSTGDWGALQVVINGTDVTYFRGSPCTIESWGSQEPWGDDLAVIDFPQVIQYDSLGAGGTVPWAVGGAQARINLVSVVDGSPSEVIAILFSGYVQILGDYYSQQSGSGTSTTNGSAAYLQVTLQGTMYQGAGSQVPPYLGTNVESSSGVADAGTLISSALNAAQGRRWGYCATVTTGFELPVNGSFTNLLEYVQDALGQMLAIDGTTQYTIHCDSGTKIPVLELKDLTTINWTADAGAPGVDTSGLTSDITLCTNVVYGSGTTPQGVTTPFNEILEGIASNFVPGGSTFYGSKFPSFNPSTAAPYPYASAAQTMGIGASDNDPGMTVNPNGVSQLQSQLNADGYGVPVTGSYSQADANAVSDLQAKAGIQVDGVVGPQTWQSIFSVASSTGGNAIVLPLYALPEVQPRLYNAQGADMGPNPAYDPTVLRVEQYLGMGAGITLKQATATATSVVLRDYGGSWAGTIVLTTDPHEGSRFEIKAGDNILLNYFHGVTSTIEDTEYNGILFHINQVDVAFDQAPSISTGIPSPQPTLQVTLSVDTAARDCITSKNYINHEPGSPGDPVRRANTLKRKSRLTNDSIIEFDASAGAGVVPAHAIYAGLWTVLRVPFAQTGSISGFIYQTSSDITDWLPARTGYPFYLAVFDQAVTANDLISILNGTGDPSQSDVWQENAIALKQAGWIISFGGTTSMTNGTTTSTFPNPLGYWPSTYAQGGPVTGNANDDDLWNYTSTDPPWLWVCEYSPDACFIKGQFAPAIGS